MEKVRKKSAAAAAVSLLARRRLSEATFEIDLSRPDRFLFEPGQRIRFICESLERDYSLISSPREALLSLCVRRVKQGIFTGRLASAPLGEMFRITGPHGYFTFRPSEHRPVFVATGTGVAPFVAMARAGVRGYVMLHGVRNQTDLYYASLLEPWAHRYVPCISGEMSTRPGKGQVYPGRVTAYLSGRLAPGRYDFYLCGRSEMIRDATRIVDEGFPDSRVYSEVFF